MFRPPSLPRFRAVSWLLAALPVLGLLGLWEVVVRAAGVDPVVLPAPTRVLAATRDSAGLLAQHTQQTLLEAALGLGLALLAGCGLGAMVTLSPFLRRSVYPLLVVSQTIPMIALAPLLVLWFGFGIVPKLLVVALVCFFPLSVAVADGLGSAEPDTVRLLRSMGASGRQIFWKVRMPQSLPYLFSGLKISVTYAVIGAVFGEWVGAYEGLGILMQTAKNSYRTDLVFAAILVTSVLSVGLFGVVAMLERAMLPWHVRGAYRQRKQ
ncbi:MAG: ABC transporter permease [Chloroflexota bacterium]|nr:ABC transporter permease [Chloroflexota bacterium]